MTQQMDKLKFLAWLNNNYRTPGPAASAVIGDIAFAIARGDFDAPDDDRRFEAAKAALVLGFTTYDEGDADGRREGTRVAVRIADALLAALDEVKT